MAASADEPTGIAKNRESPTATQLALDHGGLIATVAFFAFFFTRILVVSEGRRETAVVLYTSSPVAAALDTGRYLFGAAVLLVVPWLFITHFLMNPPSLKRTLTGWSIWGIITVVLITQPWWTFVMVSSLLILWIYSVRMWKKRKVGAELNRVNLFFASKIREEGEPGGWDYNDFIVPIVISNFLLGITASPVWLPLEHFETASESISGYTVREDDRSVSILLEDDPIITRLQLDDLVERNYCTFSNRRGLWSSTLGDLFLSSDADYPECPDS